MKIFKKIKQYLKDKEVKDYFKKLNSQYQIYWEKNKVSDKDFENLKKEISSFKFRPKFSLTINSTSKEDLNKTIKSLADQIYSNFELVIVSESDHITEIRKLLPVEIKILNETNINKNLFKKTSGDFVGIINSGDLLEKNALFEFAKAWNLNQRIDIFYSDEDSIDSFGKRTYPFFKPDWSPDLLMSIMYLGQFTFIKQKLIEKLEVENICFIKTLIWDICLKLSDSKANFHHVPKILYSANEFNRNISGFRTVGLEEQKQQRTILINTLKRRRLDAEVNAGPFPGSYDVKYKVKDNPLVSIIISTKDKATLLRKAIDGILNKNGYQNFELIVIDNRSVEKETFEYFELLKTIQQIRILKYNKPFNIAAIFNWAATKAKGEFLVFMGNDTQPINQDWLERMVGIGQRPEVGTVGAKLLFPNRTIQHAGVVLGYGSNPDKSDHVAGHPFSHMKDGPFYFGLINLTRNCSAVTGSCLLTKRSLYLKAGGFDENNLPIRFNDVDYCLKLRKLGYFIVYHPQSVLFHYESASVGKIQLNASEIKYMRDKWAFWEDNDPFYNPNLTLTSTDYTLRIQ